MSIEGLRRIRRMKDTAWWRCPGCGQKHEARDSSERVCEDCLIEMENHGTRRPEENDNGQM